jgi:hypothetical protein
MVLAVSSFDLSLQLYDIMDRLSFNPLKPKEETEKDEKGGGNEALYI